ncbi:MAG: CPBP family intramembrane metalloprotease, partial [Actinobacteria bacterium]|nr:CPBP family intramembrane metalloprotease [Actinomycetota bacterium]
MTSPARRRRSGSPSDPSRHTGPIADDADGPGLIVAPEAGGSEPWRSSPWGVVDAVWGWFLAVGLGALGGAVIIAAAGYRADAQAAWPLWLVAVTQVPLWVGLAGAPFVAARRASSNPVREFGFRFTVVDVPAGLVIGVVAQLVLVPAISWPWLKLLGKHPSDLSRTAEQLVSKAHDPLGVVLLITIVVIGAPFIEELFYRGLLLRSLQKSLPAAWMAVVVCGLVFGA